MDRAAALQELPTAYAVALRLRDAGADLREIAVALAVPDEAVDGLLEIGESKLRALLARGDSVSARDIP